MFTPASLSTDLFVPSLRALKRAGPLVEREAQATGLRILADHGINIESFAELSERIPYQVGLELLENAVEVSGDDGFALHAADALQRGDLGLYQYITGSAGTLRESIALAARFVPLLNDAVRLELTESGDLAHWRQHLLPGIPPSAVANEYLMLGFLAGGRHVLGAANPPLEVWLMHRRPRHAAVYSQVMGTAVHFERECNAIVMPRAMLDIPLKTADESLLRLLLPFATQRIESLRGPEPFLQRLREVMRSTLRQDASLAAISRHVHMSESTIQRRLRAAGTSFRDLLDQLRREEAMKLMADLELTLSEVAYSLGFAHRSALHRAFVRWYGCSPSEHRERTLQSEFYSFYSPQGTGHEAGAVAAKQ